MMEQVSWERHGERLLLKGVLEQETLLPLWEARHKAAGGVATIDLSGLERADTAGLALLIHLVALAQSQGHAVVMEGVSENLLTLARLYNLSETLLPFPLS